MTGPVAARDRKIGADFSFWLDAMRWLAAWAVLVAHIGDNLLVYVSNLPAGERPVAYYAFALIAGFGHPAVMAFFVISGFLVGGGYWRSWAEGRAEPYRRYLMKRILRLDLVLVPALLLTLLLDLIGKDMLGGAVAGIYAPPQSDALASLACNLAFLQTAACREYGTNGALWSLFNEFWYYVLWPPLMAALVFPLRIPMRIGFVPGRRRRRDGADLLAVHRGALRLLPADLAARRGRGGTRPAVPEVPAPAWPWRCSSRP
ncbi:MAG: acyltransferase [Aliidongia sp.]